MDEVGSDITLGNERRVNNIHKMDHVNRMRKLRKAVLHELPPPYPNGWYSIIESSELKRGEAKSVIIFGEHLVVFRTLNTMVYVLDAYCPHLGANIGVGGRVVGDTIVCPFHQWSFRGSDGVCDTVPYSTCAPQFSKLKKWISREVNESIFVWYCAEAGQEPWDIPVINEIETNELVYQGRNEFYVNCHIQEIPENGADIAHFSSIHSASILSGGAKSYTSLLKNAGKHNWDVIWKQSEMSTKHIARLTLTHSLKLTPYFDFFRVTITGEQIGPSYVQLHLVSPTMGRIEILQTIIPIKPMVQKVIHRFYAARLAAPFVKFAIVAESVMFERDILMWNHKTFRKYPDLVKEDSAIKLFRIWYQQFYSDNSRTFSEVYENLEW